MFSIAPLKWPGVLTTIVAGAIIGLERQIRGKPIGIRTAALICLGTYVFIAMSVSVGNGVTDPSRVIGQVITGIGFLGAGVILSRDGMVLGVTSAAVPVMKTSSATYRASRPKVVSMTSWPCLRMI